MIYKNTYGLSVGFSVKQYGKAPKHEFTGSALQRKKTPKPDKSKTKREKPKDSLPKLRCMSRRTKQKIRKKITCFARTQKRLSFVTLTFLNRVTDKQAVDLLRKFLDNVKKRSKNFEYVWVAERQTKNTVFKGNVHFHMITNKYWKIEKWWNYWMDLQIKNEITPREENYRPSSAFDVKQINTNEIAKITSYLTKYVTKNNAKFDCQVWNCSKGVSKLYTDFYTGIDFMDNFKRLDAVKSEQILKRDTKNEPFLELKILELNKKTLPLYNLLDNINHSFTKGD